MPLLIRSVKINSCACVLGMRVGRGIVVLILTLCSRMDGENLGGEQSEEEKRHIEQSHLDDVEILTNHCHILTSNEV